MGAYSADEVMNSTTRAPELASETVEEAVVLGARAVRDIIYGIYLESGMQTFRDYFPSGPDVARFELLPPAAFPLQIAVVTADDRGETLVHDAESSTRFTAPAEAGAS